MTLTYRSEYAKLALAGELPKVQLLQEWLASRLAELPADARASISECFTLLPHCTEKTNAPAAAGDWQKVFAACGLNLATRASGCCGMAGTFGHEADKRALSETIYRQSWQGIVAGQRDDSPLLATGYSCRCQVALMDDVALPHPASALLRALTPAA